MNKNLKSIFYILVINKMVNKKSKPKPIPKPKPKPKPVIKNNSIDGFTNSERALLFNDKYYFKKDLNKDEKNIKKKILLFWEKRLLKISKKMWPTLNYNNNIPVPIDDPRTSYPTIKFLQEFVLNEDGSIKKKWIKAEEYYKKNFNINI